MTMKSTHGGPILVTERPVILVRPAAISHIRLRELHVAEFARSTAGRLEATISVISLRTLPF